MALFIFLCNRFEGMSSEIVSFVFECKIKSENKTRRKWMATLLREAWDAESTSGPIQVESTECILCILDVI